MKTNLSRSRWSLPIVDLILETITTTYRKEFDFTRLITIFNARKELGIQRYKQALSLKTPLEAFVGPAGNNGILQSLEELADAVVYLKYEQMKQRELAVNHRQDINQVFDHKLEQKIVELMKLMVDLQEINER